MGILLVAPPAPSGPLVVRSPSHLISLPTYIQRLPACSRCTSNCASRLLPQVPSCLPKYSIKLIKKHAGHTGSIYSTLPPSYLSYKACRGGRALSARAPPLVLNLFSSPRSIDRWIDGPPPCMHYLRDNAHKRGILPIVYYYAGSPLFS